jgi:hypothetical protein
MHACMEISALPSALFTDSPVVLLLHWQQHANGTIHAASHEPYGEILVPNDACP